MEDNSRVMMVTLVGALLGGAAGYLLCTPQGRLLRRHLESSLEDTARELVNFRSTISKASAAASEGWRLLDDFSDVLGERSGQRHGSTHQAGPF